MTRSLTNEIYTPYKDPKREFRSSRRHFKTLSLDELRSPDFNLLSDQEHSEEEEDEEMAKTMEQYMSKTRTDYGLGEVILFYNGLDVLTRQILDSRGAVPTKTAADAKTAIQEMAEYSQKWHNGTSRGRSTETSDGLTVIQAQLNNLGRDIKKVNEKIYAAQEGDIEQLLQGIIKETMPILRYKSEGNLWKKYCHKEPRSIDQKFTNSNRANEQGASVSVMPLSTYPNLGLSELAHTRLTVELADRTVKYPKGIIENVLVGIGKFTFPIDFIILDMPEDIRVPLILGRPFLSTAHAKIDVYKRKITLRVGEENIIFKSVKPTSSIIKRVYMLSLRERMELDLEARLMGETLVINRSLDPFLEDYIELNDLNEPFELRRNHGDDLMPTIKEDEIIKEFKIRNEDLDTGIDDYPILENMDAYRDEGIGDVIFGEPFLREADIKAKRFERRIPLYKVDDEVNLTNGAITFEDLVKEKSTNIGGEFSNLEDLEVLES
ncbi:putative reverse transcriptase domain-containing protein [Tanacetum coccineum]